MISSILGQKISQTQMFLEDGTRIPVTRVNTAGNTVVYLKNKDKHGYDAIQLGFGISKKTSKAILGHIKGAKLESAPRFLREIEIIDVEPDQLPKTGDKINVLDVLKPGDMIDVIGLSKGKGYAGGVKRHHFHGGPRTHGQSDRERAPGSIGQSTTPGRVYKGKRMAGRMGQDRVTVKNLTVIDITNDFILIKGLIPGSVNSYVIVEKVGENKKFKPLYQDPDKKTATTETQKISETQNLSASENFSDSVIAREVSDKEKVAEVAKESEVKEEVKEEVSKGEIKEENASQ